MSSPDTLTWDLLVADGGARRPSLDDVGGAVLIDDPDDPPPVDGEDIYAAMGNQWAGQIQAIGKTVFSVAISVTFSGSTPSIAGIMATGTNVDASAFTVTDNGVGDTTLSWTSGDLPPMTCSPMASLNGTTPALAPAASKPTATSIRIVTKDASNVAADLPFTVGIL